MRLSADQVKAFTRKNQTNLKKVSSGITDRCHEANGRRVNSSS